MIDLGSDGVYVDYEENCPVELARGFSDVAKLHRDLIFQIHDNKRRRHSIARVWNANVRFENGRTLFFSVDIMSVLRTTASLTRSASRSSLFVGGLRFEQTNRMSLIFAYIVHPPELDAFSGIS